MSNELATAPVDHDVMADQLEATGNFRVLRRALPFPPMPESMTGLRRGVVVDVETTGLDAQSAIIQLAILPFAYDGQGRVVGVDKPFVGLEDPLQPIPPKVTLLTGLTIDDVSGKFLDYDEVEAAVGDPSIVIAHHASFDRRFLEARFPFFERMPFGCSMTQVPWDTEGFESAKLGWLMMQTGLFHDAHDAAADCFAVLTLLARTLPSANATALSVLLEAAASPTHRIWAVGAPIEFKDHLKGRGYRWNPGNDGRPRAWFKDVGVTDYETERRFLTTEIYQNSFATPVVTSIDAFSRFSIRS